MMSATEAIVTGSTTLAETVVPPVIAVVGEILVDLIEDSPGRPVADPGGSPATVAAALAALGRPTRLLTQLSDDPLGRRLLAGSRPWLPRATSSRPAWRASTGCTRDAPLWKFPGDGSVAARKLVMMAGGGDGAWAHTPSRETNMPAVAADMVDAVGAGDAFTAGLLCALDLAGVRGVARRTALAAIDSVALHDLLTFAAEVAARAFGRRGANPPLPPVATLATSVTHSTRTGTMAS
jgi:fructokinase